MSLFSLTGTPPARLQGSADWSDLWGRLLDPLIFSQTGHVALVAALAMLASGGARPFALWLLALSVAHHVFTYTVLSRVYRVSVPRTRHVAWFPLANLVIEWILIRSILSCLTGRVTWRGTSYGSAPSTDRHVSEPIPRL